jgi:hypothetical protein
MPSIASFQGAVRYRYSASGPLSAELKGLERGRESVGLLVHFAARGAEALPAELHDVELDVASPQAAAAAPPEPPSCTLRARGLRLALNPARLTIHRDLRTLSEAILPPRPVRWRMRVLWRLVFFLIRFRLGQRLLLRRYAR